MLKYTCQCLNVAFEMPSSTTSTLKRDELIKQLTESLNSNTKQIDFIKANFNELVLEIKTNNDDFMAIDLDIHLNTKFPLLTGYWVQKLTSNLSIKLNKCLICNSFTHLVAITNTDKSSSTNINSLSHSSTSTVQQPKKNDIFLLVNNNQMKPLNHLDISKEENYSHLYDIIMDTKRMKPTNEYDNIFGLDSRLTMESEIGKKVFVNRIEDMFNQKQKEITGTTEETYKLQLLDLVSSLLKNNNTTKSSDVRQINQKRRVKRYENENILSSSVFEMEDDEQNSIEHFLSDECISNEEDTTTGVEDAKTLVHLKKNVLKKRNSNIEDDCTPDNLGNMLINRKINRDQLNNNKYSCSLPRDIPVMHGRLVTFNKANQSPEEDKADNENHYYTNNEVSNQKRNKTRNLDSNRHTQSTSFKNQESDSSPFNNDLFEGDDELFEDDSNLAKDCETDAPNMGQAISNLASSIVIKDGRELFGGVPSRRVPINSISKSCFE